MNFHELILLGRATQDAEEVVTRNEKKMVKFSLAINELNNSTKIEKKYFYNILIFGNTIDKALDLIKKGDVIIIHGKPEINTYISKINNEAKASISVLTKSWKVLK